MNCRYYRPHMDTLLAYCKCLYSLEGCGAGGPLHILLDDDNYDTESIAFCLRDCLNNPEHEGSSLGILICKEYLKLSMEQRALFDSYWNGHDLTCKNHWECEQCELIH